MMAREKMLPGEDPWIRVIEVSVSVPVAKVEKAYLIQPRSPTSTSTPTPGGKIDRLPVGGVYLFEILRR
jgi:hypothetical protein